MTHLSVRDLGARECSASPSPCGRLEQRRRTTTSFNETEYTVAVPDGVRGGEGDFEHAQRASLRVAVRDAKVGDGAGGVGGRVLVEFDQEFEVIVPEGLGFGDELEIEQPAPAQPPRTTAAAATRAGARRRLGRWDAA